MAYLDDKIEKTYGLKDPIGYEFQERFDMSTILENAIENKDKYLHSNEITGDLEWQSVEIDNSNLEPVTLLNCNTRPAPGVISSSILAPTVADYLLSGNNCLAKYSYDDNRFGGALPTEEYMTIYAVTWTGSQEDDDNTNTRWCFFGTNSNLATTPSLWVGELKFASASDFPSNPTFYADSGTPNLCNKYGEFYITKEGMA